MGKIEERKQYAEGKFREVVKAFDVKEDEIEIVYLNDEGAITGYRSLNESETEKEPKIGVWNRFFSFTKEKQRGMIAHEIGHHESMKDWSIPRLKRNNNLNMIYSRLQRYTMLKRNNDLNMNRIFSFRPYWEERLKKWYILKENSADNKVAKTEYGKGLLEHYKDHILPSDEVGQALIKNLEEKLREMGQSI